MFALAGLAYHDYEGVALREDERARLVADLGSGRQMILRNHGLLTCGRSVAKAFLVMYTLESACQIQILAQSGGTPLVVVPPSARMNPGGQANQATNGLGADLAWPGLLRRLDRIDSSYRQ